jgi:hypothetical protein
MEIASSPSQAARSRSITRLWSAWSPDLASLAALVVLTAAVAWDRLHADREVVVLDNVIQFIPWYSQLGDSLREGHIQGWLPSIFSGIPFAADTQSGWMYFPAMIAFTFLAPIAAFKSFIVFHLLLAGLSSYVLGRLLGLGSLGSLTLATIFEFGPFLRYTGCCLAYTEVAAWVPFVFIGIELAVRSRSWLSRSGGWLLAGFALSQQLAGWIGQGAYYAFLAAAMFIAFRTLINSSGELESIKRRLVDFAMHCAGAFGFAIALGAAGALPRLDAVSRSSRAGGSTSTNPDSFPGWSPSFAVNSLLSLDHNGHWYVGGSVFALAVVGVFIGRNRKTVSFFGIYTVILVILAMVATPLHGIFFLLPRFEELHTHVPSRVFMVLWVGPAYLAGATLDRLAESRITARRLFAALIAMVAIICIGSIPLVISVDRFASRQAIQGFLAVSVLIAICVHQIWDATFSETRGPTLLYRAVLIGFLVVIFWDISGRWYGEPVAGIHVDPNASDTLARSLDPSPLSGSAAFLQEKSAETGTFRYFGYDPGFLADEEWRNGYRKHYRKIPVQSLLVSNRAMTLGLEDVQGYNPVQIERYTELFEALNGYPQEYHELNVYPSGIGSPLLDILNAKYIIIPAQLPPGRPDLLHISQLYPTVYQDRRVRIVENPDALDRAWIVHEAVTTDRDEVLPLLASGEVNPRTTAVIETTPPEMQPAIDSLSEFVTFDQITDDRLQLTTTASAAGMLVVSDAYDPNWKAYVDGEEVDIVVADYALRGIPIAAGTHAIEMRYESRTLRVGLAISLLAFAVAVGIVGLLLVRFWRGRRVPSGL